MSSDRDHAGHDMTVETLTIHILDVGPRDGRSRRKYVTVGFLKTQMFISGTPFFSWLPCLLVSHLEPLAVPLAFSHRRATVLTRTQSGYGKGMGIDIPYDHACDVAWAIEFGTAAAFGFPSRSVPSAVRDHLAPRSV